MILVLVIFLFPVFLCVWHFNKLLYCRGALPLSLSLLTLFMLTLSYMTHSAENVVSTLLDMLRDQFSVTASRWESEVIWSQLSHYRARMWICDIWQRDGEQTALTKICEIIMRAQPTPSIWTVFWVNNSMVIPGPSFKCSLGVFLCGDYMFFCGVFLQVLDFPPVVGSFPVSDYGIKASSISGSPGTTWWLPTAPQSWDKCSNVINKASLSEFKERQEYTL